MVVAHQQAQDREVEIKLELDPADAARLAAHPLLRAAPQEQNLVSVYFDTPSETLRKAGVYLRIRDIGGRRVQTSRPQGGGGLFDRLGGSRSEGTHANFSGAGRTVLKPCSPDLAPRFAGVRDSRQAQI
jgi:hypothetical protein